MKWKEEVTEVKKFIRRKKKKKKSGVYVHNSVYNLFYVFLLFVLFFKEQNMNASSNHQFSNELFILLSSLLFLMLINIDGERKISCKQLKQFFPALDIGSS